MMQIRHVTEYDDEPAHIGKVGLWINGEYLLDAAVTVDQLLELRARIDVFLWKLALGKRADEVKP